MAKAPSSSKGNGSPVVNNEVDNQQKQLDNHGGEGQKDNGSASEEEGTLSSESTTVNSASHQIDNSNTHAVRWDQMFARLQEFKQKHGHCRVPNRYKADASLGSWVSAQRRQYKIVTSGQSGSTAMTRERAKKLVDLGFEWSTSNPHHVTWETRYEELKAFVQAHGHAQVPMRWQENEQLSNWVSKQRQDYKLLKSGQSSRLSQERLKLLRDLGFVWEVDRATSRQLKGAVLKSNPEPSLPFAFPVSVADGGGESVAAISGSSGTSSGLPSPPAEQTRSSIDSKVHGAHCSSDKASSNATSTGTSREELQHSAREEPTQEVTEQTGTTTVPSVKDEAQQDETKQPAVCDATSLPPSSHKSAKLEDSDVTPAEEKAAPMNNSPETDDVVKQGVTSPSKKKSGTTGSRSTGSSKPKRRSKRRKGND